MKTTVSAVLNSETLVSCWKVTRQDGTTFGFTDHDADLEIDSVTYMAASGFSRTATRQSADLNPDNLDLQGVLSSAAITDDDLAAGLYLGAEVWHFQVDWSDTAAGKHKLDYGMIGPVTRNRNGFVAEFYSLSHLLNQTIGRKYSKDCQHVLGDSNCGIELEPSDWAASTAVSALDAVKPTTYDGKRYVCTTAGTTGATEPTWDDTVGNATVDGTAEWTCYAAYTYQGALTAVTDNQTFADSSRTEADDYFKYGILTWQTGNNAGLEMHVKAFANTGGAFTLLAPMPFEVQVGDTYKVSVGCNHKLKLDGDSWGSSYSGDCRVKFNLENGGNAVNYGGFPELPGNDTVLAGPDL